MLRNGLLYGLFVENVLLNECVTLKFGAVLLLVLRTLQEARN